MDACRLGSCAATSRHAHAATRNLGLILKTFQHVTYKRNLNIDRVTVARCESLVAIEDVRDSPWQHRALLPCPAHGTGFASVRLQQQIHDPGPPLASQCIIARPKNIIRQERGMMRNMRRRAFAYVSVFGS